jgi:hypothetical protein
MKGDRQPVAVDAVGKSLCVMPSGLPDVRGATRAPTTWGGLFAALHPQQRFRTQHTGKPAARTHSVAWRGAPAEVYGMCKLHSG